MKGFAIALLLVVAISSVHSLEFGELMKKQPCLIQNDLGITGNVGEDYKYDYDSVPDTMMWNNVNNTNFLTVIKNQHLPQYCGSCWAQCVASSLSDRIKIMRKGAWPDVNIAPQVFVSCSMADNGCHGGDLITAFKYGNENELTDETCAIYKGRGHDNGNPCSPVTMCRDWGQHKPCFIPSQYHVYKVDKYGTIKGEQDMMAEIAKNGPIACAIDATDELFYNYTGGIFEDKTGAQSLNHGISVVGYGEENGVKFWHVRNSWGDTWGEKGFFRVVRGKNNIGIESYCSFGIPLDTWSTPLMHNTTQTERDDPRNDYTNGPYPGEKAVSELLTNEVSGCYIEDNFTEEQKNFVPEKLKNLKVEDLPTSVDWRDYNGTNYLSYIVIEFNIDILIQQFNIFNWNKLNFFKLIYEHKIKKREKK